MFWTIRFVFFWVIWFLFADKTRWREMIPVCILASLLGSLTDILTHYYPLWSYDNTMWAELSDDLSVYPVVVYLFIQWLPQKRSQWILFTYGFVWTFCAILIELYHVYAGYMSYPTGEWNLMCSYVADWMLFGIFYRFHQSFSK